MLYMHKQVSLRRVLRPKILLSLGLAAGVLALGGWFYWYNQTPVVGVVHEAAPESRVAAVTSARFNGKAVAFDYSTAYQTVENKDSSPPPVTEQYGLGKHDPAKGSDRIRMRRVIPC